MYLVPERGGLPWQSDLSHLYYVGDSLQEPVRQHMYPSRVYCELLSAGTLAGTGSGQDHYFGSVCTNVCTAQDAIEGEETGSKKERESWVVELSAEWIMPANWLVQIENMVELLLPSAWSGKEVYQVSLEE